jgi:hypothetical protein
LKGRKSRTLQYVYWQCEPIKLGSFSSILEKEVGGGVDDDEAAILAVRYRYSIYTNFSEKMRIARQICLRDAVAGL